MSELLKIILSLSLSGTLLFFIILALKPLYKDKLSKRWQYYVWLIVVVRMLLPFTTETTLVGFAFAHLDNIHVETIQTAHSTNDTQSDFGFDENHITPNTEPQAPKSTTAPSFSIQAIFSIVYENLWMLWAAISFALLIRKITMYQSFVRFVKAGGAEVSDIEILNMLADIGETVGVKRPVELFVNPLISSPMLLGFFRPYIIFPSIELDSTELAYIMRHELTHYKHLDMFYKWLVQIMVCLHWFDPFAHLLAKEINKCCELSCDEAIIRTLDKDEKKAYGDTLLNSLKAMGHYNDKLATVTLTEGAEQIKERLDAIMKFKKKSKAIVAITFALTTVLCVGAAAVGAYAAPQTAIPKIPVNRNTSNKVEYMSKAEEDEIRSDLGQNPFTKEDVKRLTLEEVPNDMRAAINSCGDKKWYVIEGHGRQYIYYNNLPHNYAYQYEPNQNSISIVDIGKSTGNYLLLSVPLNSNLTISYNSKSVTYKTVLKTPSLVPKRDYIKVSFTGVSVTGQGPVGVELVRSQKANVTFELLNLDNMENCTAKADIIDGTMQIAVNNYAPNGINVNFGPDYKNVVRVYIPDAIYTKFDIQSTQMVVKMQDFNAPVNVESNRAGFWLIDKTVSQGTYNIKVSSGPIYIEADTILKDITANAANGPITVRFNKMPVNLYLDSTNCGPVVERPGNWPAIYKVGSEIPQILLSNTGKAVIGVQNDNR